MQNNGQNDSQGVIIILGSLSSLSDEGGEIDSSVTSGESQKFIDMEEAKYGLYTKQSNHKSAEVISKTWHVPNPQVHHQSSFL